VTPAPRRRGRLLVLEGIDGAGKTSVQRALLRRWKMAGLNVVARREPSDPVLGRQAVAAGADHPALAAMFFTLDRLLARPALERALEAGTSVLQDRSFYSTLVYQGARLSPRPRRELAQLQEQVAVAPDRVALLDLSAPEGLRRVDRGRPRRSPIERLAPLRAAATEYRRFARREHWIVVDASVPVAEVVEQLDRRLRPLLAGKRTPARRRTARRN
jgi:dTMP kinase